MNLKLLTLSAVVILAVGASLGLWERGRNGKALSQATSRLHPNLPSPAIPRAPHSDASAVPEPPMTKDLFKGEGLPVRPEQLESYLAANHRNTASLLAALRLTGDRAFLDEAIRNAPNDPRVAYEAWFRTRDEAEQQKWLETWERSNPRNSLPAYLAAASLFKSGMNDAALGKLEQAAAKSDFSYFSGQSVLDCEEAYKAAGYSEAEAKMAATMGLLLPHLGELRRISQNLADLASGYRAAGDDASAQAVLNIGFDMAGKMAPEQSFIIEDLVQLAIENNLLKGLNPNAPTGVDNKTVQQLQDELAARREALKADSTASQTLVKGLNETDLAAYCDRVRLLGERAAVEWLNQKFGPPESGATPVGTSRQN